MNMKKKIESIRVESQVDNDPDTSFIGKFTDSPSDNAIVRYGEHAGKFVSELGDDDELPSKSREYRFFIPAMTALETGNPDSPKQDWQRMESLNDGQWCFIGIVAKAVIVSENGIVQTLRSGGLWGIESDSGREYLNEVAQEELSALRSELESFGFSKRQIDFALKNVEIKL